MSKKIAALSVLLGALLFTQTEPATLREIVTCETRYERAQRQTVEVETEGCSGSAFLFKRTNPEGQIRVFAWTAAHVVDKEVNAVVRITLRAEGEKAGEALFPARVIGVSEEVDVALLLVNMPEKVAESTEFFFGRTKPGQEVYHVGNFFGGRRFDDSVSVGVISQVGVGLDGWHWGTLDQTTAIAVPGSSGGPVFDRSTGKVVGILVGAVPGVTGIGFYVPVRELEKWASSEGFEWAMRGGRCPSDNALPVLVEQPVIEFIFGPPSEEPPSEEPPSEEPPSEEPPCEP